MRLGEPRGEEKGGEGEERAVKTHDMLLYAGSL